MTTSTRPAPQKIIDLVEHFSIQLADYKAGKYNETQLRRDFLDPFFAELGWDMTNEEQSAERYREVINEMSVEVEGKAKAADYAFRIGGTTVFFLEAKKPFVNVGTSTDASFQIRRYAWSAKLPISIVSDFEQLAIYDCRNKPNHSDAVHVGRLELYHYTDFIEKWDEIYNLFSKKAVKQGALERYAKDLKGKRGTADVDDAFLVEMERWREALARNIALRNAGLSTRQINAAVQLTIDRIIFLRICEERGIEAEDALRNATDGIEVYEDLMVLFQQADRKYNSGLFHFNEEKNQSSYPDTLTPQIKIDDKVLKDILANLYYPKCPYAFKYISADILGQVYERFLGKVIRLTAGHQAKVEEKPEVRKAGGVYYTPTYIVAYIVKNTVGELLKDKSPADMEKAPLRVLDPSCGSGSFLLGAYQFLLDWYLDWYEQNDPHKWNKGKKQAIMETRDGWQLTMEKKKDILTSHIFGVDIDQQAVEVTKLSLLLKVVENPGQLSLLAERILPDLSKNIQCGNSLIGPDYYADQQMTFLDEEEQYRVNAFDWQQAFPQVFREGGFGAVIGNPPYLRIQGLQEYHDSEISYIQKNYQSAVKRFDLYLLFIEKGYQLLKYDGMVCFICPHKFINSDFGSGIRHFFISTKALYKLISFNNQLIFSQASTYTGIIQLKKSNNSQFLYFEFGTSLVNDIKQKLFSLHENDFSVYNVADLSNEPWVLTNQGINKILNKINNEKSSLGNVTKEIMVGVQSGIDNIHILELHSEKNDTYILKSEKANGLIEIEKGLVKPILRGEDVHRYDSPKVSHYCIYPYELENNKTKIISESLLKEKFPLGYSYLREFKQELFNIRERQKTNTQFWYSCHRSKDMNVFESSRIITPEISLGCNMTLVPKGIYHNTKVYSLLFDSMFKENTNYWLGILNSKIMWWFISNTGYVLRGGYFVFKTNYLKPFPVRTIDFNNPGDVAQHERMVSLVQSMLDMHKQLQQPLLSQEKERLQRQIDWTDKEIDKLVYALYGLTDEEIRIVEG